MSVDPFTLDTNILVYAVDSLAGPRHVLATEIVDRSVDCDCRLTLQALSEFFAVVTRKRLAPMAGVAAQVTEWLSLFPTMTASADAVRAALAHAVAGRASYWDALLIETAAEGGCAIVLSADLQNGARLGAVSILNPFEGDQIAPMAERLLGARPT
ncbi:MAG TPA: PIN domain-containing protein [Caulobacteraceae bacterium]|nr:PIN domain-containing protein [Caulobacteraceae bacterium]